MRQVWQKRWPHAVADKSVGLSMQMTQVKVLKVVAAPGVGYGSGGAACTVAVTSGRVGWGLFRLVEGPGDDA